MQLQNSIHCPVQDLNSELGARPVFRGVLWVTYIALEGIVFGAVNQEGVFSYIVMAAYV